MVHCDLQSVHIVNGSRTAVTPDYPSMPSHKRWRGPGGRVVGQAADAWQRLVTVLTTGDVSDVLDLYSANALFLEPYNPPHRGNLLIQSYVKDWMGGKDDIVIDELVRIESPEGDAIGVEWTISYTAAGRRWNALPRASFLKLGEGGLITYHRDYT